MDLAAKAALHDLVDADRGDVAGRAIEVGGERLRFRVFREPRVDQACNLIGLLRTIGCVASPNSTPVQQRRPTRPLIVGLRVRSVMRGIRRRRPDRLLVTTVTS